jgi:hypothetical protein
MITKFYVRFYKEGKSYSLFTERILASEFLIEDSKLKIKCRGYLAKMITDSLPDRIEFLFRELEDNGYILDGVTMSSPLFLDELDMRSIVSMELCLER